MNKKVEKCKCSTCKERPFKERPFRFIIPEWAEKYRDLFQDTGGNKIEDIMNDHSFNVVTNGIKSMMVASIEGQMTLLRRLKAKGFLAIESVGEVLE